MGTTTLKTRRKRLAALMGFPESRTITGNQQQELDHHIASALREIYARHRWPWLESEYRITLLAATSAGTIAGTAGDTAITGTNTSFDTTWSSNVRLRVTGEIYRVATVDSTTGLTLTDSLLGTISGATYTLYVDQYVPGTDLETISAISLASQAYDRIDFVSPISMDQLKHTNFITGHPMRWTTRGVDSSGDIIIEFHPIPGYSEIAHVRARKHGTVPSADTGTDDVPDRFSYVVDEWAKVRMYEYTGDRRFGAAISRAEQLLSLMQQNAEVNEGVMCFTLDPKVYPPREDVHHRVVITD